LVVDERMKMVMCVDVVVMVLLMCAAKKNLVRTEISLEGADVVLIGNLPTYSLIPNY
jgi:hypothetical protein